MIRLKLILILLLGNVAIGFCQPPATYEVIPPDNASIEHQISNPLVDSIFHVANASLQLSTNHSEYTLNAFVYNDRNGKMFVDIIVLDSFSNIISSIREFVNDQSFFPDVIIRDNIGGLDDSWFVTIIYNRHDCPSDEIYISEFKVNNPYALNSSPLGTFFVDEGIFPKIDGFADENFDIKGKYHAMLVYAIVYNNLDNTDNIEIKHYDANSNLINSHIFTDFIGLTPDIACITISLANTRYVYIMDVISNNPPIIGVLPGLFLYDFTSNTHISTEYSTMSTIVPFLRIDAHTMIADFLHQPRYVFSGGEDNFNIFFVSDFLNFPFLPLYNKLPTSMPTMPFGAVEHTDMNGGHGVAAGYGFPSITLSFDPNHYDYINTIGFTSVHSMRNSVSSNIYSLHLKNGATPNSTYNNPWLYDVFKVNNNTHRYGAQIFPFLEKIVCSSCTTHYLGVPLGNGIMTPSFYFNTSIATQPNLGKYTVACWIDDISNEVRFKQTNIYTNQGASIFSQKTDEIKQVPTTKPFTIYPIPTDGDMVNIKANDIISDVQIYSVNGVYYGKHISEESNHLTIDISKYKLRSKILFLEFNINGIKYSEKLVLY